MQTILSAKATFSSFRLQTLNLARDGDWLKALLNTMLSQMAGATVLRGPMGFGKSSHLHTAKILRLSMDLPIVIEIVDAAEKVNAFLPLLDPMIGGGLVTIEKVKVIHYRHGGAKK